MKSLAKSILTEMALDLGDTPDWIDPQKRRKIERGEHPYANNPAFPTEKPAHRPGAPFKDAPNRRDPTRNYGELVASHVYPEIVRKVQHYTGRNPQQTNPQQLMGMMQQAMQQAVRAEGAHRPELERAAVEVVLSLPEFRDAREAYEAGELHIEAQLLDPQGMMQKMQQRIRGAAPDDEAEDAEDMPQMQVEPEEETEEDRAELGLDVPEVRGEYDEEAKKRRFINLLIQGAAINKNYAYHQMAERLQQIDPNILTTYGKLMSIGELMYWVAPEDVFNAMQGSGQGGGGMEEVTPEDDGTFTIHASAMVFPVLIQELTKGLYEFLAHDEDEPAEVRKYTSAKSDTLAGEQWDIMKGPGVWRHLNELVNRVDGGEYMSRVFHHLVKLPTNEFNTMMQEILKETPRGQQYIQQLVTEIRGEANQQQQESRAFRVIKGMAE